MRGDSGEADDKESIRDFFEGNNGDGNEEETEEEEVEEEDFDI
jgi:hypothetical protein